MNARLSALVAIAGVSTVAAASPISIRVPSTTPLHSVSISVTAGNDEGDHSRNATMGGGFSPRSGAQNAQSLADQINSDPDRVVTAAVDPANPNTVKITPMTGTSEPRLRIRNADGLEAPVITTLREPRVGTSDMDEIGYITLASFTGSAAGDGVVGVSVSGFSAETTTFAGMTASQLLADLALQLSNQGALFQHTSDSLTLCGMGEMSTWTTDTTFSHSVESGSIVPTPGAMVLGSLGSALFIRRRR